MTIYSESLVKEICGELEKGMPINVTCKKVGIGASTFYDWKDDYPDFAEKVKKAEMTGRQSRKEMAIASVLKGFEKHWQAGAWYLERKFPEEYAKREDVSQSESNAKLANALGELGFALSDHYKDQASGVHTEQVDSQELPNEQ